MIRIQRWNMLRTKCFNIRAFNFGFQFNREYWADLTGFYIGVKCCIELPVKPWRIYFFIPSIETLNMALFQGWNYKRLKNN